MSVLQFDPDGPASGLQSQTQADGIRAIIDSINIRWPIGPVPEPESPYCSHAIPKKLAGLRLTCRCTLLPRHEGRHEARDTKDQLLATMAQRKPTPRPRKTIARERDQL